MCVVSAVPTALTDGIVLSPFPQSCADPLYSAMARETFVRYRTLCLLAVLAVLSCVSVGLLVALLSRSGGGGGGQQKSSASSAGSHGAASGSRGGEDSSDNWDEVTQTDRTSVGDADGKDVQKPVLTEPWEKDYRIPASTYALHYDLFLHPDMETGLFTGTVDILIR